MKTFRTKEQLAEIIESGYIGLMKHENSNFSVDILPRDKRGKMEINWKGWKATKTFIPFSEDKQAKIEKSRIGKIRRSPAKLWR